MIAIYEALERLNPAGAPMISEADFWELLEPPLLRMYAIASTGTIPVEPFCEIVLTAVKQVIEILVQCGQLPPTSLRMVPRVTLQDNCIHVGALDPADVN